MNQRDVTRAAFANAAVIIENADFESLFGEVYLDQGVEAGGATDEQLDRAQRIVVEALRRRSTP